MGIYAEQFQSERELHDWIISFYEKRLGYFLLNVGGITEYGVKITPRLIDSTIYRYSQLREKHSVTDWEQS